MVSSVILEMFSPPEKQFYSSLNTDNGSYGIVRRITIIKTRLYQLMFFGVCTFSVAFVMLHALVLVFDE